MSSNQLAERKDPGNFTAGSNEVYNSAEVTLKAIRRSREKHVDCHSGPNLLGPIHLLMFHMP